MMMFVNIFYGTIILLGLVFYFSTRRRKMEYDSNPHPISVIIPFNNEVNRIRTLVAALNRAEIPENIEFIFVDDHSDDGTGELLLSELDIRFRILKLKSGQGKKQAINTGVHAAVYENILTLDADVSFEKDYFRFITKIHEADLTILPVKMTHTNAFEGFASIEFNWLQTITFGTAAISQPVLCNGANLKFTKSAFFKADSIRTDLMIPSGDDIFLLNAVKQQNGLIRTFETKEVTVSTKAPGSVWSLANQRLRWVLKMKNPGSLAGVAVIILSNILMIYAAIKLPESGYWAIPILLKMIGEWIGTRDLSFNSLVRMPDHQVLYPVYGLFLLLYLPFRKSW